jgi:hypothetical protein
MDADPARHPARPNDGRTDRTGAPTDDAGTDRTDDDSTGDAGTDHTDDRTDDGRTDRTDAGTRPATHRLRDHRSATLAARRPQACG